MNQHEREHMEAQRVIIARLRVLSELMNSLCQKLVTANIGKYPNIHFYLMNYVTESPPSVAYARVWTIDIYNEEFNKVCSVLNQIFESGLPYDDLMLSPIADRIGDLQNKYTEIKNLFPMPIPE